MATQYVTYQDTKLLSCSLCLPANVILCLASDDIVVSPLCPDPIASEPFKYTILEAQIVDVKHYPGQYVYEIAYESDSINPDILRSTDIVGIQCSDCIVNIINNKVGNEPYFIDNGDGTTTFVSPHGCRTTFQASIEEGNWSLTGNSGTSLGTNFLGTTDNVGLDVRVNNLRALRVLPGVGVTYSPSLIGGFQGNSTSVIFDGNVIAGGGYSGFPNQIVAGAFNFIGSGIANTIEVIDFDPDGMRYNLIGGGYLNNIKDSYTSGILGGNANVVDKGRLCFIGGGETNTIVPSISDDVSTYSSIVGGSTNTLRGEYCFIGGGQDNTCSGDSSTLNYYSNILGGYLNQIQATGSFIGGGDTNRILGNADYSSISCGGNNTINSDADYSVIVGGSNNNINASLDYSFIGGGRHNTIGGATGYNSILGGYSNTIGEATGYNSILGGYANVIGNNIGYSSILGGEQNTISMVSATHGRSVIVGGSQLTLGTRSFGFNNAPTAIGANITDLSTFSGVAYFGNVDLWIGNVNGAAAGVRFYENNSSYTYTSTDYVSIKAPGTLSTTYILTLPTALPTPGQTLRAASVTGNVVQLGWV